MKIKRWAIYDGVAKAYYPKRFIFRANAVLAREALIFGYGLAMIPLDDILTNEEIDSIKIVELS